MKSRSVRYGHEPGDVQFIEVDITEPQPWEIQVRGTACGICASDVFLYRNGNKLNWGAGHEGVARITKVGSGVSHLHVGDRVTSCALGFANVATVKASHVYKIPEQSTLADEHWIAEPVSCVITGLDHCQLKPGDRWHLEGLTIVNSAPNSAIRDPWPAALRLMHRPGAPENRRQSRQRIH